MFILTEKHHAFISATYFRLLRDGALPAWQDAFLMCVRRYAEQRGFRMAMRAVRDGRPLDFAAYRHYGEWVPSDEFKSTLSGEYIFPVEDGANSTVKITRCPWSEGYLEMGLPDGAEMYCSVLDESICRGFNPDLRFEVRKTMHADRDYCLQAQVGGNIPNPYGDKENIKDFNYHTAHIYKTFRDILSSVYKGEGMQIASRVMIEFINTYGKDAGAEITSRMDTDFDLI